jgi:[ribosomal protein S5]-alanine N-acetyltransferase
MVTIKTNRLVLVPISLEYAPDIFREFSQEITTFMYPKPAENIEETNIFINSSIEKNNLGEQLQMVILKGDTKKFIGCAGLHKMKTKTPELGIWIKKSAQGFKFGQEAIAALENWAQNNLNFDYLIYPVDKINIASRKIPESLGGIQGKEFKQINQSGVELDEIEYRIFKKM